MKKKLTSVLAIVMSMLLLLSACGTTASTPTKAPDAPGANLETINVAFELPLTGASGGWDGALMRAGIEIGQKMYADEFAALGVEVKPIINDHECSSDTASVNIVKDIEMHKTPLVFGTYTGPLSTMASVCEENKVLLINGRAPGDSLVGLNDWLYNTYPCYKMCCEVMADFLYKQEGYRKVACIGDSGATSKSQHDSFVAAWEKLGGEVVCDLEVESTTTDYLSYCAQIIDSGAEVVLLCCADESLMHRLIIQFRQLGGDKLGFINLGGGDVTYGLEFPTNPCYTSLVRIYSTDEVINEYLTNHKYQDFDFDAASTYVGVFVNAFMMMEQMFAYCRENNLPITGENLKAAVDAMGTFEIMGGSMSFVEGNTVEAPIDIYKGLGENVSVAASYYEG